MKKRFTALHHERKLKDDLSILQSITHYIITIYYVS